MGAQTPSNLFGSGSGKIEPIIRHCVHAIATGHWAEGHRLPSVREAEGLWGVNRLTVLKAYQRLAEMELVRNEPRRGFFVAAGPRVERVSRHRVEMDRLYEHMREQIRRDTGLSPLGVFQYLAELARTRARQRPECAFVECTDYQARSHAQEITARLGIPCMGLTTTQLAGKGKRVPLHVHTLMTTAFHRAEVMALADPPRLAVAEVPIEVSREMAGHLARHDGPVVMLGVNVYVLERIAEEVKSLLPAEVPPMALQEVAAEQLDAVLTELIGRVAKPNGQPAVILTSTLWDAAGRWQEDERVLPVQCRICDSAWPDLADALGLPLGAVGEPG
jgi:DNA-binding transcriptional regulator YhcF (GntR family)